MGIEIRKAKINDFEVMNKIGMTNYQQCIRKPKKQWIATYLFKQYFSVISFEERLQKKVDIYVACLNNKVVGFIELEDRNKLASCYVDVDYHRQGIGALLLKKAEELCLKSSKRSIYLDLDASDYAVDFYKKFGFTIIGKTKRILGVNMTPMQKKLK